MRANTDVKTFIFYDERECGSCFHVLLRPLELQGGEQEAEEEDRARVKKIPSLERTICHRGESKIDILSLELHINGCEIVAR